jgi:nuclear pore complex protein Nup205
MKLTCGVIGRIEISGDEYTVNEEFQQDVLQLADDLNLDELDAAQLFLLCQGETDTTGRPARTISIVRFHQRRKYLLDCLRIILQLAGDVDLDETLRGGFQDFVGRIVAPQVSSTRYLQRCITSMGDIKSWLQRLADRQSTASVLNSGQQGDEIEMIEFQRSSLVTQHELLSVISLYLVKQNFSAQADFDLILDTLKNADKYDHLLREHYSLKLCSEFCNPRLFAENLFF